MLLTPEWNRVPARVASVTLLGIAGLHVAWGRGSSFPFATTAEMTDAVVGNVVVPPPVAGYAVAGLLTTAAAATAGLPTRASRLRGVAVVSVVTTLATRASFGFAVRSDVLVPDSSSPRFRHLDRRVYSPLCLALAAGAANVASSLSCTHSLSEWRRRKLWSSARG